MCYLDVVSDTFGDSDTSTVIWVVAVMELNLPCLPCLQHSESAIKAMQKYCHTNVGGDGPQYGHKLS